MMTTDTATTHIRTLRPGEEAEAATIFQEAVLANWRRPKPPLWNTDDARSHEHRLAVRDLERMRNEHADLVLVAERDGELAGMAATTIRDDHAHITYVFVLAEHQTRGVGKALVEQTVETLGRHGVTRISLTSSDDRRAWTRYLKLGLLPGPPIVSMATTDPTSPTEIEDDGLREVPVDPADDRQMDVLDDLDRRIKGAARRVDRLAWHRDGAHEALVYAGDTVIGAYVVSRDHEQCRIGPILATTTADVATVLRRALTTAQRLARNDALTWTADVPGQNGEAIALLLESGFRPGNLLAWFANGPIGQWDRYIVRSEDLL